MSPSPNIFTQEALPGIIRQSFFLNDNVEITPALTDVFLQGCSKGDFSSLATQTKGQHIDSFSIFLSHDIDWLNPSHPYSILKYFYAVVNRHSSWYPFAVITKKDALLRNMERLIGLEQKHDVSSLFFTGAGTQSMGRHDIRYTVSHPLFRELIALLTSHKHITIGLHSSYHACKKGLIGSEAKVLESFTGKQINTHRSHFLNYTPDRLYEQLEQSGIQYDFSYGNARTAGLKNSFPGKFRPVDLKKQRAYDVTCLPLILMDNAFFFHPYKDVMNAFRSTIHELKNYNGSASILFHPENMILKPDLWNYYEEIIDICKQAGANLNKPIQHI